MPTGRATKSTYNKALRCFLTLFDIENPINDNITRHKAGTTEIATKMASTILKNCILKIKLKMSNI